MSMNNLMLIRPEVQKKTTKNNSNFLPADLAAAYACYHDNIREQRKLEQKLHIIHLETNQMKCDFRQQRGVLEKELKQNEEFYWNCHRVFSAATLITESDSYKKRLYTGPQPTKAKLPRRTLERLSILVRKFQAEDDLETLLRFQRCARFARRGEDLPQTASSSTLAGYSELNSLEFQRLTELELATAGDGSAKSIDSRRIERIRSAPSRVASGKRALADDRKGRHGYPVHRLLSPETPDEIYGYLTSKGKESSRIRDLYGSCQDCTPARLAWAEEEAATVDEIKDASDGVTEVDFTAQPGDEKLVQKQQSQSRIEQKPDVEKFVAIHTGYETSQTSDTELCNLQRNESLQSQNVGRSSEEGAADEDLLTPKVIFTSALEEKTRGDGDVAPLQGVKITRGCTPRKGSASEDTTHLKSNEKKPLVSVRQNEFHSNDLASSSDLKADNTNSAQLPEACKDKEHFFETHRTSQPNGDEITEDKEENEFDEKPKVMLRSSGSAYEIAYKRRGSDHKAQRTRSSSVSVTLPKSSVHGLSSRRKSLTPRIHHKKPRQRNDDVKMLANAARGREGRQSQRSSPATSQLNRDVPQDHYKEQNQGMQPNAQKKRRVSIFKRKRLSEVLYSGQVKVESQLRNRVQGFLGNLEDVGEGEREETDEHSM